MKEARLQEERLISHVGTQDQPLSLSFEPVLGLLREAVTSRVMGEGSSKTFLLCHMLLGTNSNKHLAFPLVLPWALFPSVRHSFNLLPKAVVIPIFQMKKSDSCKVKTIPNLHICNGEKPLVIENQSPVTYRIHSLNH